MRGAGVPATTSEHVRTRAFGFVSLFTSAGTLICCALPALLVLLGLGATVASVLSVAPWLVTLSQRKVWVFTGAGILIALNFAYVYGLAPRLRGTRDVCARDELGQTPCAPADRMARILLWVSAALYGVGFFSAYTFGWLLAWSDG